MLKIFLIVMVSIFRIAAGEELKTEFYKIGSGAPKIVIVSGIHGDEVSGIALAKELLVTHRDKKGTLIVIPEGNMEAVKLGVRTPYYMDDLNRSFPGNNESSTGKVARDIFNMIHEEKPDFLLDLHESYYKYSDGKDPKFYLGDTIIASEFAFEKHMELLMELDFTLLGNPSLGSLIYEVDNKLNVPSIVLELSRDDELEIRMKKGREVVEKIMLYFDMKFGVEEL